MKVTRNTVISLILFVVVLVIYVVTLCPTIFAGDSAEFVASATGASLVKPTSHPTWFLIAKLFKLFSPKDPAYGLNLMSAFFGAWTVALLYMILANLPHIATTEEMSRHVNIPLLRQITAISGCLLLAFTPVFWGASILAGPATMNAFFFVLTAYNLVKYLFLRKKRYIILFGAFYGIALANSPVMLLFIPVVFVLYFVRCRELFEDPLALGISIILFLITLFSSVIAVPWSYTSNPSPYLARTTFIQAFSFFQEDYYFNLKDILLPLGGNIVGLVSWLFVLVLPTFFMPIYLGWRKQPASQSMTPSPFTPIKIFMTIVFTVIGLIYIFGHDFFSLICTHMTHLQAPQYVLPLVFIASWLSYVLGYWIVIIAGKKTESSSFAADEPLPYSKSAYSFLALIVILIPLVSLGLNIAGGQTSKRGFRLVRSFCEDVLRSSDENCIIVVPPMSDIKRSMLGLGDPIRYVTKYPGSVGNQIETGDTGKERKIIDLLTAMTLSELNRIDLDKYIAWVTHGGVDEKELPRMDLPDSGKRVYDRMIQENLRENFRKAQEAIRAGARAETEVERKLYMLHDYMVFKPENITLNRDFQLVPTGLLYLVVPYATGEFDPKSHVEKNDKIWDSFVLQDAGAYAEKVYTAESGEYEQYAIEGKILNKYGRSANDQGLLCAELGITLPDPELKEKAKEYFERSIGYDRDNYSALTNLAEFLENEGADEGRIAELRERAEDVKSSVSAILRGSGMFTSEQTATEGFAQAEDLLENLQLVWTYGFIKDPDFYQKLTPAMYPDSQGLIKLVTFRRTLDFERYEPYLKYLYLQIRMYDLAAKMNPADPSLLYQKANYHTLLAQAMEQLNSGSAVMERTKAILDYETAVENKALNKRAIFQYIGELYSRMSDPRTAEEYYKIAIDAEPDTSDPEQSERNEIFSKLVLVKHYIQFKYNLEEAVSMAKGIAEDCGSEEKDIFTAAILLVFRAMLLQDRTEDIPAYVDEFAKKNPAWEDDIWLNLAGLYRGLGKLTEAARIYERIGMKEDPDGEIALTLAKVYQQERRWNDVIGVEMRATSPTTAVLAEFHFTKGNAHNSRQDYKKALSEYEEAWQHYESTDRAEANKRKINSLAYINARSWMYYLIGVDKDTENPQAYLDKAFNLAQEVYNRSFNFSGIRRPGEMLLWDAYAWLLFRLKGEQDKALEIMELIYTGNRRYSQVMFHYGAMLYEKGVDKTEGLNLIGKSYKYGLPPFEESEALRIMNENNMTIPDKLSETEEPIEEEE